MPAKYHNNKACGDADDHLADFDPIPTAPTEEIRDALVRLVSEPQFRTSAVALGDAIDAELGASTLIADLEGLARGDRENRPVAYTYRDNAAV